jgi:hypothetical protein
MNLSTTGMTLRFDDEFNTFVRRQTVLGLDDAGAGWQPRA